MILARIQGVPPLLVPYASNQASSRDDRFEKHVQYRTRMCGIEICIRLFFALHESLSSRFEAPFQARLKEMHDFPLK